jgi:SH3-like domain-containing protein
MEKRQFIDTGAAWQRILNSGTQIGPSQLVVKRSVSIRSKRVVCAKAVIRELITLVYENRSLCFVAARHISS